MQKDNARLTPLARPSLLNPADVMRNAETYAAHGRTAQAISILEKALRDFPVQPEIEQKLRELQTQTPVSPPILLRSLAMGVIAASLFGAIGFLILPGTQLGEIFNWPATLVNNALGYLAAAYYRPEADGSGPIVNSIFFWIVAFAAIHFGWSRSVKRA